MWYLLAHELHMPVRRVMRETTSREFMEWREFLLWRWNEHHPLHHYLAQIAAEIRRGHTKSPGSVRNANFMMKFSFDPEGDAAAAEENMSPEEREARIAQMKATWMAILAGTKQEPPKQ